MKRSGLSVSALALLAGSLLAHAAGEAHAQAPSVLQPRGGWSVTKMDQPSNGTSAYCALARQYEKDIIFTLGRNLTDEYSLAVDFQKEQMNPETAYKLTLTPGAGQVRAFDLMPLSARAMVIRLGWDDSFFKALESSRMLRVGIGDVDYGFNMPDIAAGQKDLQACVDGLKDAAKTQQSAQGTPADAKEDVLNAEATAVAGFSARKATKEELKKSAMSALPAGIETADAVPAPAVNPLPPSAPVVSRADKEADDMMSEMATLRAENNKLAAALESQRAKLADSYTKAADSNTLAEMEEKIRLLESENKRLRGKGSAVVANAAPDAAGDKAAPAADNAQIAALQRQLNDLTLENADMTQKLAAAQALKAPAAGDVPAAPGNGAVQLQALEKNLALVQAEKNTLQGELEALRRQVEDERMADASGDGQLEKAVRRYNEAEREIQRLGAMLEQERATKSASAAGGNKQAQRVALLEKELEKAKTAQASISTETREAVDTAKQELLDAQAKAATLQQQNANLETEISQLKVALASARQSSTADSAAQAALQTLREESARKDQELSALQQQLKTAQAAATQAGDESRALTAMKARAESAEKEREEFREQAMLLKGDLNKTKSALMQTQGLEELQATLDRAEKENRDYAQQVNTMEAELKRLRAVVALDQARAPQSQDMSAAALNDTAPAAGYEPPPLKPVDQAAAVIPTASPAASSGPMFGEGDVKALLSRAGIGVQGGLRKVAPGIYGWKAGTMAGRAEVLSADAGFARLVDQHINKAKSQCNGDFAAIPSGQGAGSANFEVACVNAAGGTSSSIAFFEQKGSFVAIAVDSAADNMDVAMDTRDRIASAR